MVWFDDNLSGRYSGVRRPVRRIPTRRTLSPFSLTTKIIILNVLVFVGFFIILSLFGATIERHNFFLEFLALRPDSVIAGQFLWTIITHMFMHANFTHILVNMVSLFFLGGFIERIIGKKRFFWLYIIGGLVSAAFFVSLSYFFGTTETGARLFGSPMTLAVGASGAIFALGGLMAVLVPKMEVLAFMIIPMKMWQAMTFFMVFFWTITFYGGLPIGNSAHLGGLVTGLAYGFYLKYRYPRKTKMIADVFS